MEKYKLCYIDGNKAWFTNNLEKQWGDDWNDVPYEHNAGEPYDYWNELLEDNEDIFKRKWKHHEIKHKVLYFETEDCNEKKPCDMGTFSVEDINKKVIAWLHTDKYDIYAGTIYEVFIKVIKDNGGKIFIEHAKC